MKEEQLETCYYSTNIKAIHHRADAPSISLIMLKNISFEAIFTYAHVPVHRSMYFEQDIRPSNKQTHPSNKY